MQALIRRDTGTVIVVAPDAHPWSGFERSYFKVCEWQDASLPNEVTSDPYAVYDADWNEIGRSKWVDASALDLTGPDVLPWATVVTAVRTN